MKILHLITSLKVGGAESALVNYLSKVVGKDGNAHLVVYFHHGPNVKKIEDLGINICKITGLISIYDPFFFYRLVKLVRYIKPDIIHSSLWSANIIARLISKFYKIPVVCDLHGNSFDEGKFRNWLDRRTVNYCAKIVSVSESVKDSYLKNIIGAKDVINVSSKLVVIKNGIDVQALRDKALKEPLSGKNLGLSDDDFVIGAVGRLEPIKSYDVLIKAFAKFLKLSRASNAKLLVVGYGTQRESLVNLVKSLGIECSVIFVGYRSDAYKFYPLFDCFALSSQSEGLSIALLEAMSFGLPVISTHPDLNHDVIKHGINGFLVLPGDIDTYALAINRLYQDQKYAKIIGQSNKELVKSNFNINVVMAGYQNVYQDVFRYKF